MKALLSISLSLLTITSVLALDPLAPPLKAKPAAAAYNLSQFQLGSYISGPQQTLADAAGKAVLIDAWGIDCGPCLASLPEIEAIAQRYKGRMLVFGAHSQGGSAQQVQAVAAQKRLTYTITQGVEGPVQFNSIPHVFVFDSAGALLFSGHPGDRNFLVAVQQALRPVAGSVARTAPGGTAPGAAPSGLDQLKRLQGSGAPRMGTAMSPQRTGAQ